MNKALSVGLLALSLGSPLLAAPAATDKKPEAAAGGAATPATAPAAQTDIIGTQEAPSVFNVVPWKDKPSRLPKKEVTTSILRETLQPLDPEVLRREIELQKRLGEQ
ncbi:MAG: hypothetical protein K0S46_1190 [Moraxellaceae bacterium]|jgi:hypothetical protein|nr:hypothetical protein [Moraxellaceae bacterium]